MTSTFKTMLRPLKRLQPAYRRIGRLYEMHDFLDAYRAHTDAKIDRKTEGGPYWEQMGQLQFVFLILQGLKPQHRMLDIGCGQLRGGRYFIEYLDQGGYTGTDISPKAIDYCRAFVINHGLSHRQPVLAVNEEGHLRFGQFNGRKFDIILAQSVFSHLPGEAIGECFAHLHKVMEPGSRFYFTYMRADVPSQIGIKSFCYPFSFFEDLAARYGFVIEDLSARYRHPRGQDMLCARFR